MCAFHNSFWSSKWYVVRSSSWSSSCAVCSHSVSFLVGTRISQILLKYSSTVANDVKNVANEEWGGDVDYTQFYTVLCYKEYCNDNPCFIPTSQLPRMKPKRATFFFFRLFFFFFCAGCETTNSHLHLGLSVSFVFFPTNQQTKIIERERESLSKESHKKKKTV